MKYAWIQEHRGQFTISQMCRVLKASRTGFNQWRVRPLSERAQNHLVISAHLQQLHVEHSQTYGRRRMKYALAEYGIHAGEQCIRRLMAKLRLITVQRLKWRKMSRRIHAHGLTNHLLDTQVEQADQVWVQEALYR